MLMPNIAIIELGASPLAPYTEDLAMEALKVIQKTSLFSSCIRSVLG